MILNSIVECDTGMYICTHVSYDRKKSSPIYIYDKGRGINTKNEERSVQAKRSHVRSILKKFFSMLYYICNVLMIYFLYVLFFKIKEL